MPAKVQSIIATGTQGTLIDIECHLSNNLPNIVIVGFANKAVDEARERIRGAFATSRIMLPRKRITINLAPADLPKADSSFDLAIAVAILLSDNQVTVPLESGQAFIGELGLGGNVRAVRGIIGKILIGRARGISTFYIPTDNLRQAQLIPNVTLIPVSDLSQLYGHLNLLAPIKSLATGSGKYQKPEARTPNNAALDSPRLSEVVGQEQAKRALEIAAAGGHNVFFSGPPGTGKSMLAKALPSVLPPLSREEMLEVTHLHSLASHDYEQIIAARPFRAPHHSASYIAITGGGAALLPGEISLAHRGVLFFDELPEFGHDTLEALRQPLEDRVISIARAHGRAEYPANFILVATGNPCPCGYNGTGASCDCTQSDIKRYTSRLSGPVIDRIDLHVYVHAINHERLLTQEPNHLADNQMRESIAASRQRQAKRFGNSSKLNTDMTNDDIKKLAFFDDSAAVILNSAALPLKLSARAYMRTIKVARTIADLDGSPNIKDSHMQEALGYRYRPTRSSQ